jgi:hypothetical protein
MREDVAFVEARAVKTLPGDLTACDLCGQRPDSITFNTVDCRPGCPLASTGPDRVESANAETIVG